MASSIFTGSDFYASSLAGIDILSLAPLHELSFLLLNLRSIKVNSAAKWTAVKSQTA